LAILFSLACAKPSTEVEVQLLDAVHEHILDNFETNQEMLNYGHKICAGPKYWEVYLARKDNIFTIIEEDGTIVTGSYTGGDATFYLDKETLKVVEVWFGQ